MEDECENLSRHLKNLQSGKNQKSALARYDRCVKEECDFLDWDCQNELCDSILDNYGAARS